MSWTVIVQVLPELIKLAQDLIKCREVQVDEPPMDAKELKRHVRAIRESVKKKDADSINNLFNSL